MTRLRKASLAILVPAVLAVAGSGAFAYQRSGETVTQRLAPEDQPDPGIDFIITGPAGPSKTKADLHASADERPAKEIRRRARAD